MSSSTRYCSRSASGEGRAAGCRSGPQKNHTRTRDAPADALLPEAHAGPGLSSAPEELGEESAVVGGGVGADEVLAAGPSPRVAPSDPPSLHAARDREAAAHAATNRHTVLRRAMANSDRLRLAGR